MPRRWRYRRLDSGGSETDNPARGKGEPGFRLVYAICGVLSEQITAATAHGEGVVWRRRRSPARVNVLSLARTGAVDVCWPHLNSIGRYCSRAVRGVNQGQLMKKLLFSSLAILALSAHAQDCTRIGSRTFCDNGTNFNRIGNQTSGSDGSSSMRIGNQTVGNDGSGGSWQSYRIGNTTYGHDSSGGSWTNQRIGNQLFCK